MAKEKGRKKKEKAKGKKGRKKSLKLAKESEMERAKANATLWETRLEITELSRTEYRDASRKLAQENEELKRKQYKMEKDAVSVLSYLKKQDMEKGDLIEKLKQQLVDAKKQAQEENEKLGAIEKRGGPESASGREAAPPGGYSPEGPGSKSSVGRLSAR
ncbi:basal body-orientation factor 1-like isoform X2 [Tachyglossus aculeatus]|uniref:basal body-orientation factor 1-like isoform X2 n=1 Tax=Tachyglossus aculeatus TaxID=9261 RepID=UPI0018F6CAB4|nr:basal body-orientation factor 1-like isoform X2 [Tachyglossus aculeatus]